VRRNTEWKPSKRLVFPVSTADVLGVFRRPPQFMPFGGGICVLRDRYRWEREEPRGYLRQLSAKDAFEGLGSAARSRTSGRRCRRRSSRRPWPSSTGRSGRTTRGLTAKRSFLAWRTALSSSLARSTQYPMSVCTSSGNVVALSMGVVGFLSIDSPGWVLYSSGPRRARANLDVLPGASSRGVSSRLLLPMMT
jgi:hypothetical protein